MRENIVKGSIVILSDMNYRVPQQSLTLLLEYNGGGVLKSVRASLVTVGRQKVGNGGVRTGSKAVHCSGSLRIWSFPQCATWP